MFFKGLFFVLSNINLEISKLPYLSQKHVMQGECFSLHLSVKSETKVIKLYQLLFGRCAKLRDLFQN